MWTPRECPFVKKALPLRGIRKKTICQQHCQVRRMLQRIREHGDGGLVHGLRGRRSNRKLTALFEEKVLTRVGQRYADFGPTLAAEHLAKDGFRVSRETLRIKAYLEVLVKRRRA